jgi:enamine deaminase RidA (YjgF/YER057c/UK114 family)
MDALVANNDVRTQFYLEAESAPPATTWIECTRLVAPEMMIEIECIALLD